MNNLVSEKEFNLEKRSSEFAVAVRKFVRSLSSQPIYWEDSKQVIRSSASIGANYIEACEALSRKDFLYRMKVSRKEARESVYWLGIISASLTPSSEVLSSLIDEATQLMKIFGSIISKSETKKDE